jgi:hypothetical protein
MTTTVNTIDAGIQEVDNEVWSDECTVDELQRDLCKAKVRIARAGIDWGHNEPKVLTVHKYYLLARELMKWIPIARPVPEFRIRVVDLSPKVIRELEARIDSPPSFSYILKQAVGRIFENIDFTYYHQSIARHLRVRLEP